MRCYNIPRKADHLRCQSSCLKGAMSQQIPVSQGFWL
jgi:hypothetical protein